MEKSFRRWVLLSSALPFSVLVSVLFASWSAQAESQLGQVFNSEGPGPAVGPRNTVGSADNPPNGTTAGAIEAIAADPTNPNILYVGAVDGGIWKSVNGGATWTALTDQKSSISIASLSLDPTDATHKTVIAGNGNTSNGGFTSISTFSTAADFGGVQNGLLYSRDGGATFARLGATAFNGQSVVDVQARGSTILAATFEPRVGAGAVSFTGGFYRSTDGGATFVQGATGLPAGPITSLVGDPANANTFYAAVTASSNATYGQTAIYRSTDGGATWTAVFTSAQSGGTITAGSQTTIKLTAGPAGTIGAGVVDIGTGKLTGLFYSGSSGGTWSQLNTPAVNGGAQAPVNIALAIDPHSPNIIYVSGDNNYSSNGGINALAIARVNASNPSGSQITAMSDDTATPVNTSNGSTTHPDSRALTFDASGRLLIGTDGGIYARTNPLNNTGQFIGLNNLSTMELYSLGYDANSKRLVIAAQDNGTSFQATPGGKTFNQIQSGDGINARINDTTLGTSSAIYTTTQFLGGATRTIVDSHGNITGQADINLSIAGGGTTAFTSPLVLNNIDPTRMAASSDEVFVTQDSLTGANGPTAITLNLTSLGTTSQTVTALDYGARNNMNAIVAGSGLSDVPLGALWISTTSTAGSLVNLPSYAGMAPTSVKFDARSDSRFFVADSQNLYGTVNRGTTFQALTVNLPANFIRPTSLGFIDSNGVAALLVGGLNNADNAGNPLVVADSDAAGTLSGWRRFGSGLPNTTVNDLRYNSKSDTLAVGTVGRGAYLLYDVTSNFASASVLQFGLADNDSTPDPSILFGNRPLVKYGTGILSITGAATYTGLTTVTGGTLSVAVGASLASNVLNNATFLNAGTVSGLLTNSAGITIDSGALNGGATVSGGTLTGTGSVANLTVGSGAFAPGNGTAGSSMTINGSLAFSSAAFYLVQINPATSSFASVSGTAAPGGAIVAANYANGGSVSRTYTILTAAGGINGAFGANVSTNLPANFTTSLSYDSTHAYLNLALNFAPASGAANTNRQSVADALNRSFNGNGGIPMVYATLSPGGLTSASGETAAGSQQTTFDAMKQFLGSLLDPFIDGRGEAAAPPTGARPYAEEADASDAYASTGRKRTGAERDAYGMITKAAPRNPVFDPRWSVWAAGFGGSQTTDGNAALGSNTATSRIFGTAVGADYRLSPFTLAGFALAGGGTNFSVANGGSGRSDLFQAGAFIKHNVGPAYMSAALAYAWQDVTTDRTVTVAGVDRLRAEFNANTYSGRVEGGYRFVMPWIGGVGITPYAAGQFTTFDLPAYAEQVQSGANTFALAYGSKSVTDTRSELGIRTDKSYAIPNAMLTLRGRLAWAHDFNPDRNIAATFQALPGASFVVNGTAQAHDTALTTASAEMRWLNGWSAAATFEGELSDVTRSYAGKGVVRYAW
jgi:autotransporter-associated beta strand protein